MAETKSVNPANAPATAVVDGADRKRIPMSVPLQKLQVPDQPGYKLYWMRGTPDRIQQALNAGYEFVSNDEVTLNQSLVGGDAKASGSTDLGSRVSVVAGGRDFGPDGQPVRLYLMRIKEEWWNEDQKVLQDRNEQIAASIRGGMIGAEQDAPGDASKRYAGVTRPQSYPGPQTYAQPRKRQTMFDPKR